MPVLSFYRKNSVPYFLLVFPRRITVTSRLYYHSWDTQYNNPCSLSCGREREERSITSRTSAVNKTNRSWLDLFGIIRYAGGSHVNDTHLAPSRGRLIVVGGDNGEQSKRTRSPRPLFIVMRRDVDHGRV